jgi:hypothetical protein
MLRRFETVHHPTGRYHRQILDPHFDFNGDTRNGPISLEGLIHESRSHDLRTPLVNIQGFGGELERAYGKLKSLLSTCAIDPDTRQAGDPVGLPVEGAGHLAHATGCSGLSEP